MRKGLWKNEDPVDTVIVSFILNRDSRTRRGATVKAGTECFAIEYELGGYFTYSYTTIEAAKQSRWNQINAGTNTYWFYRFNVVDDVQKTFLTQVK